MFPGGKTSSLCGVGSPDRSTRMGGSPTDVPVQVGPRTPAQGKFHAPGGEGVGFVWAGVPGPRRTGIRRGPEARGWLEDPNLSEG